MRFYQLEFPYTLLSCHEDYKGCTHTGTYCWVWNNNNNNYAFHLFSTFLGTHDVMAAILRQNAHHTPAYWWRGDRVMKPISVWGWLEGHDGQRPVGEFGQDAWITPLLFSKDILGFLTTTESQDLSLTSHPKDSACWQYSVPITTGALRPTQTTGEHPLLVSLTPLPTST